jgi:hypothetical protein
MSAMVASCATHSTSSCWDEAPWKVIALLAVVFLACIILPKPYRKYFWFSAVGVVITIVIWVFLPEKTEGWRPYTFDRELAELQAKYDLLKKEYFQG